jgi:hypothetical protein
MDQRSTQGPRGGAARQGSVRTPLCRRERDRRCAEGRSRVRSRHGLSGRS